VSAWSWECEDDDEVLGYVTMLSRAGLEVEVRPLPRGAQLVVPEHQRERAEELSQRMRAHFTRRVEAERQGSLALRERKGLRALGMGTVLVVVLLLMLLLRQST